MDGVANIALLDSVGTQNSLLRKIYTSMCHSISNHKILEEFVVQDSFQTYHTA